MSRTTGTVASIRLTMPFSVTSRVFYPYQKPGVRIHRQLVALSKEPVNTFAGAVTFVEACSFRFGSVQSKRAIIRLPNTLFPFSARNFSTCRVHFYNEASYDRLRSMNPDALRAHLDKEALSQKIRAINDPELRRKRAEKATRHSVQRYASDDIFRKLTKLRTWQIL